MTTSKPDQPRQYDRDYYQSLLISKAIKDKVFKKALAEDPKAVLAREFGVEIPDNIQITVLEEDPSRFYIVIPATLPGAHPELPDEALEAIAGGADKTPKPTTEPTQPPNPTPTYECCGFLCKGTTTTPEPPQ